MIHTHLRQDRVAWETDPEDGESYVDISTVCGSSWWAMLEGVVGGISCESCREHAQLLLSGMHDLVNINLGKPVHDRANFEHVARSFADAVQWGLPALLHQEAFSVSQETGCPIRREVLDGIMAELHQAQPSHQACEQAPGELGYLVGFFTPDPAQEVEA